MANVTFSSLGLNQAILKALAVEGYAEPTPIQAEAIPQLFLGRDLLGCAQTGTGKTAAFALPIIQMLSGNRKPRERRSARVLIVTPTRELAAQIDASFAAYGAFSSMTRALVYGGVGKPKQVKALAGGVDVLTATPGRLLDLHGEGTVRLDLVEIVVLDEADRMLDMGFIHDMKKIIALLPAKRQTLLFSATMPDSIVAIARSVLRDPVKVAVDPVSSPVEKISQSVMYVGKKSKKDLLVDILREPAATKALVFTRTKHLANRLAKQLVAEGIEADAIHANKSQNNRQKALARFKDGDAKVLIATDIAARGIDIDDISHVINYDIPEVPETYVHRIGRTARAGASGTAISFCDPEEKVLIRAIERLIDDRIPAAKHRFEASYGSGETADAETDFVNRPPRGSQPRYGRDRTPRRPMTNPSPSFNHAKPSRPTPNPSPSFSRGKLDRQAPNPSRSASGGEPRRFPDTHAQSRRGGSDRRTGTPTRPATGSDADSLRRVANLVAETAGNRKHHR